MRLCLQRSKTGAGPALGLLAPEPAKGLFEQVGGVQSLVGLEQPVEEAAAGEGEVLAVGEQGVAQPLDESAVLGGEAAVLTTADLVERVAEKGFKGSDPFVFSESKTSQRHPQRWIGVLYQPA